MVLALGMLLSIQFASVNGYLYSEIGSPEEFSKEIRLVTGGIDRNGPEEDDVIVAESQQVSAVVVEKDLVPAATGKSQVLRPRLSLNKSLSTRSRKEIRPQERSQKRFP